jgi:hypothetical protein
MPARKASIQGGFGDCGVKKPILAVAQLQQGFAPSEMGFNDPFALPNWTTSGARRGTSRGECGCGASGGRERQSRLSGPVDFCHCGLRGARDRAYRTISPNSAKQTNGASTDKISHPTSMRSPKLFRHHRGRSIESGRDAINTIAIATPYPIKRSIIAFYPFTNRNITCANRGKL